MGTVGVGALEPGESEALTYTWTADQDANTFGALANSDGDVEEGDTGNNQRGVDFTGAVLADLVVESLSWSPSSPAIGSTVTFTAVLRNQGQGVAVASQMGIYLDNGTTAETTLEFPAMSPNQQVSKTFTWTAVEGVHTFLAVVDTLEAVPESNESNNERSLSYDATLLPDLTLQRLLWTPTSVSSGQTVTFTIDVLNQGAAAASASQILVYFDGGSTVNRTISVGSIGQGEIGSYTFTWTAVTGLHTFLMRFDGADALPENDEANNEVSWAINVSP